jgi:hypothetical protein
VTRRRSNKSSGSMAYERSPVATAASTLAPAQHKELLCDALIVFGVRTHLSVMPTVRQLRTVISGAAGARHIARRACFAYPFFGTGEGS